MICMAFIAMLCFGNLNAQVKVSTAASVAPTSHEYAVNPANLTNSAGFNVRQVTIDGGDRAPNTVAYLIVTGASTHVPYTCPLDNPSSGSAIGGAIPGLPTGGDWVNEEWIVVNVQNNNIYKINPTNGSSSVVASHTCPEQILGMAYHNAEDIAYVCTTDDNFYKINLTTGATEYAFHASMFVYVFTITNDGRFIGMTSDSGPMTSAIIEVNPQNGQVTTLFSLPFFSWYVQDMSIDRETNTIYWAGYNYSGGGYGYLYKIDLDNNQAVNLGYLPDNGGECVGFAIPTTGGNITFCPVVTNLKAEVQGNDVKLTWTAAEGNPTGYQVSQGATILATVTETEYVVKNLADGKYTFSVAALYDDGCTPKKVNSNEVTIKTKNPIKNLDGKCDDGTLNLSWDKPDTKGMRDEITIQWSGEPNDGIGTGGSAELWPANRWTPSDLAAAGISTGMVLEKVSFVPQNISGTSSASFTVKVWQGGSWTGGTGDPGTELCSQAITPTWNGWNEITLNTPITIDASQELWIGYQMVATGGYPAGCDAGPVASVGKSNICKDMLTGSGWCLLTSLNSTLTYNWCVRGKIVGEAGVIEISNYDIYQDDTYFDKVDAPATTYTKTGVEGKHNYCVVAVYDDFYHSQSPKVCKEVECATPPICNPVTGAKAEIANNCTAATITWTAVEGAKEYKIKGEGVDTKVTAPPYTETGEYLDGVTYKWTITTVCEAGEAESVEVSATGCFLGISEFGKTISIYPNPVNNGTVNITATNFAKVEVYSSVGQLIVTQNTTTVDVSNYQAGIYFFKVFDTNNNTAMKRISVIK